MPNTSRRRRGGRRGNNNTDANDNVDYNNNDGDYTNNNATSLSNSHQVAPQTRSEKRQLCEYLILNFFVGIFAQSTAGGRALVHKFNPELVRFSASKEEIFKYIVSALPKSSPSLNIFGSRHYLTSLLDEVIESGDLQRVSYVAEQGSSLKGFSSPLVAAARCLKENVPSDSRSKNSNNKPFFNPDSFIEANERNYDTSSAASSEVNKGNFYIWNPWRRSAYFTAASLGQRQQSDDGDDKMTSPLRFISEVFLNSDQLYLLNGDLVQKFFSFVRSRVSSPGRLAGIDPRSCVDPEKPNQRVCDNVTNFSRLYFFADALRVVGYDRVISEDHFLHSMTILGWHNANVAAALLRDLNEYKCAIRFMFNGANINLKKIASSPSSAIGVLSESARRGGGDQPDLAKMEALNKIVKLNNNNNSSINSLSSTSINSNQHDLFRQQQARNTADVATSIITSNINNNDFNSDYRVSPSHSSPRAPSSTTAATIVGGGAAAPSSSSPVSSVAPLRGAARGYFDDMKINLFPVSSMEVPKSFLMNMLLHKEGWTMEQQSQNLAELVEKKLIHFKVDRGNNSDDGTKVCLGEQQQQQQNPHHDAHRRDREDENSSNNQRNEVAPYSSTTSSNTNVCIRFPPPALIRDGKLVTRGNPGKLLSVPPPFVRSSSSSSRKNN